MAYCPTCGSVPGTRLEVYTWDVVYVRHPRHIDGIPEWCPGSGQPVGPVEDA